MKIKSIDRQTLKMLRPELEQALKALGEKYGLAFTAGNGSFGGDAGSMKININVIPEDGKIISKEAKDFEQYAELYYKVKPSDLGRTIIIQGRSFVLTGLKLGVKRPFVIKDLKKNKNYQCNAEAVKAALGIK